MACLADLSRPSSSHLRRPLAPAPLAPAPLVGGPLARGPLIVHLVQVEVLVGDPLAFATSHSHLRLVAFAMSHGEHKQSGPRAGTTKSRAKLYNRNPHGLINYVLTPLLHRPHTLEPQNCRTIEPSLPHHPAPDNYPNHDRTLKTL